MAFQEEVCRKRVYRSSPYAARGQRKFRKNMGKIKAKTFQWYRSWSFHWMSIEIRIWSNSSTIPMATISVTIKMWKKSSIVYKNSCQALPSARSLWRYLYFIVSWSKAGLGTIFLWDCFFPTLEDTFAGDWTNTFQISSFSYQGLLERCSFIFNDLLFTWFIMAACSYL